MAEFLLVPVAVLYGLTTILLFMYGLNFFYLTWIAYRRHPAHPSAEPRATEDLWPPVTVQLPIFNELYVAERLIEAVCRLDYPQHLLEIQVLDDSTDETSELIRGAVKRAREDAIEIIHLHRTDRKGYKAGALAEGLARARGEFLAVFDADFVPRADFLRRTLPCFSNSRVAFVQARWGHLNHDYSFLTRLQSLAIDAHFMVEQFARYQAGHWFNFNGTAGVWRRTAIDDAGGWKADTLTEDLDLSYRAFLKGWQAVYLRDVEVPAELPVSFSAYRRQQHRWACGSLECAVRLIPRLWHEPVPVVGKLEATLHLTGYGVHLLLFALALLYPLVLPLAVRFPALVSMFGVAVIFNLTAFAPTLFFVVAQRQLGQRWWLRLPAILFTSVFGAGMMLNTVRAAYHAFYKRSTVFERTPKFGIASRTQEWRVHRYQLRLDGIVFLELALGLLNLGTLTYAARLGNWGIAIYSTIFFLGLVFTSGLTIFQSLLLRFKGS